MKYFGGLSLLVNLEAITSQLQQFPRRALTISSHNAMSYCNFQYICFLLAIDPSEMQNIFHGSLGFLEQYSLFFHFIPNQRPFNVYEKVILIQEKVQIILNLILDEIFAMMSQFTLNFSVHYVSLC